MTSERPLLCCTASCLSDLDQYISSLFCRGSQRSDTTRRGPPRVFTQVARPAVLQSFSLRVDGRGGDERSSPQSVDV